MLIGLALLTQQKPFSIRRIFLKKRGNPKLGIRTFTGLIKPQESEDLFPIEFVPRIFILQILVFDTCTRSGHFATTIHKIYVQIVFTQMEMNLLNFSKCVIF